MTTIQTGVAANPGYPDIATNTQPAPTKKVAPDVAASSTTEAVKKDIKAAASPTLADLKKSVNQANKQLENSSSNQIRFAIDKATGIDVVKLVDQETGKTIRQYPSKQMLEIAQSLEQSQGGSLIKQDA